MCDFFESLRSTSALIWKQKFLVFCTSFIICLLSASNTQAQVTWDGGAADDNWSSANNWNPNGVPTATDDVIIPDGITGTITIDTDAVCSTFTMNDGGSSNTVTISGGNSLTVSNEVMIGTGTGFGDAKTLAVNAGTLTCSSITLAETPGLCCRTSRVTASSGTINVSDNIIMGNGLGTEAIQFTGAGTLNLGGSMTGGAFTASTSTVNLYGHNQSIGDYVYNNLTLSGTGNINPDYGTTLEVGGNFTMGADITFTTGSTSINVGGNWVNNGATLDLSESFVEFNGAAQSIGGTEATSFEHMILSGSGTKTFIFSTAIAGNLFIENGVDLDLGTFTSHTADGLSLDGASQAAGTWGHSSSPAANTNDTYFANNTGVITTTTTGSIIYYSRQDGNWNNSATWSTITYGDATNNSTFPSSNDIVRIGGTDLIITVNVASACKTLSFEEDGDNPTLNINAGITLDISEALNMPRPGLFEDQTLNVGSGTLNAGSINFSGGTALATSTINISTGTVTVSGDVISDVLFGANPTIAFSGAGILTIGGNFYNSSQGNFTASTSTVVYNGNSSQEMGDFTYNNLTLSGSGEKTVAGVIDVDGDFTLASGTTFTTGSFTHTFAGDWINNGVTFNNSGSTISLDGAAQNIGGTNATSFNRLHLGGSGTKTLNFSTTIAGNFSIDGSASVDLGTITSHTADGLTLGGVSQVAGTWGHSSSPAANTNDTYFANNTGVITASNPGSYIYFSRQTGNWNNANTWSTITYGDATNNGSFPVAGDIVNVGGGDFTITVNVASACYNLYFELNNGSNTIVSINSGITLDVAEEVTIPYTPNFSADQNTLAVGAGTLNAQHLNFSSTEYGGSPTLTISTGTANIDGNIISTGDGEAVFTFTDAGLLQLGGAIIGASSLDLTAGTGTVEYDGTAAQTIVDLAYYNLTLNNSSGLIPSFTLNGNTTVTNTLTMTEGVVDMDEHTFTLGTSTTASTLNRVSSTTTNWLYNGTYSRFWRAATAVTSNSGNYYGLSPIGSATANSYRPVEINSTVDPTGDGRFSVSHTSATSTTDLSPVFDDGGTDIVRKHDASFVTTTTATGGTYNIDVTMTDLNTMGNLSDIRLALNNGATTVTTVGTHAVASGSVDNPTASRTGVALANLVGDWRVSTTDLSATPLPVDLISFAGQLNQDHVALIWSTASEIDNDYFELEKSIDGENYQSIGTVSGSGDSNRKMEYSFKDRDYHEGINYYRLKQVDYDGNFEIFEPIAISVQNTQRAQLTIYPNPSKSELHIRLDGMDGQSKSTVVISDHMGKIVYQESLSPATKQWSIENLNTVLVPGIYLLNVQTGSSNLREKLVIQL